MFMFQFSDDQNLTLTGRTIFTSRPSSSFQLSFCSFSSPATDAKLEKASNRSGHIGFLPPTLGSGYMPIAILQTLHEPTAAMKFRRISGYSLRKPFSFPNPTCERIHFSSIACTVSVSNNPRDVI